MSGGLYDFVPDGYRVSETATPVAVPSGGRYWRRGRADREAERLNARRIAPSYRWEVREDDGRRFRRFVVVAFQNVLERA